MPFAEEMVSKHGEFYPYAVVLDLTGQPSMQAGDPRLGDKPSSDEVLATLVDDLRRRRHALRAVALVSDVRLEHSDAIRVETEHVEGIALMALLPYSKTRRRDVEYGELFAVEGTRRVWND